MSDPVTSSTTNATTVYDLYNDLLRLSHSFLGVGHFRYAGIACKMFLQANLTVNGDKKITNTKNVTSSISCARQYFDDQGTGTEQLRLFWYSAARYGRVDVMEWAYQQGYSRVWKERYMHAYIGEKICAVAAQYGRLSCLQYLIENGCEWNDYTVINAAANGHLSILQWAKEIGCSWNSVRICNVAAECGHLTCLKWARENGFEWDCETCTIAAFNGHLSCLQWARENGCPWNKSTYRVAKICGNPDLLKYVIDQGCPRE